MDPVPQNVSKPSNQLQSALECITATVMQGLEHGFFKCEIRSTIGKHSRREILIEAGVSHKFIVPMDELPK